MPKQITAANGTSVKYSYFADGTKFKAVNAASNGFAYTGSLRWSVQNGVLTPESVAITGGRALYNDVEEPWSVNYYITDHLGSVRAVTDAEGEVLDTFDYMPYGSEISSRSRATTDYRFTGKERQSMVNNSIYDSFARFQNTYGRFMSIDPKAESFYHISPYAYCAGDPVNLVDPDGEKIKVIANNEEHYWREYKGEWGFYNEDNKLYSGDNEFVKAASEALTHLMIYSSTGFELVEYLSNHISVIQLLNTPKSGWLNGNLGWNINSPEAVPTTEGLQSNVFVNLGHELAHAKYSFNNGPKRNWYHNDLGISTPISEIYTTHYENKIRSEMELPLRTHYLIDKDGNGVGNPIIQPETRASIYYDASGHTDYKQLKKNIPPYIY